MSSLDSQKRTKYYLGKDLGQGITLGLASFFNRSKLSSIFGFVELSIIINVCTRVWC